MSSSFFPGTIEGLNSYILTYLGKERNICFHECNIANKELEGNHLDVSIKYDSYFLYEDFDCSSVSKKVLVGFGIAPCSQTAYSYKITT